MAGALILTHAISHFRGETTHTLYFWCLLITSLEIFLLVLIGHNLLLQMPRFNLLFRSVEIIFFLGIGTVMLFEHNPLAGVFHLSLASAYGYLLYCERIFQHDETLSIHHTGISIPDIPEFRFLYWTHINKVETHYDSIDIVAAGEKPIRIQFRHNLNFEELEQVQAFCRFYLPDF